MTIQQLIYAITIAEQGSFNKASEVLYITQPSLTNAVKELEKELGVTIFYRSGKGVSLTNDGEEFLFSARQVCQQFNKLLEKFGSTRPVRMKYDISTQHYSFVIKNFAEMIRQADTDEYEFTIRETTAKEVIDDVKSFKSEIGILCLIEFNRIPMEKLLHANQLEFTRLTARELCVYLWKKHPLAKKKTLRFEDLTDYPFLFFEQDDIASFYFSDKFSDTDNCPKIIKTTDRATMLNLMAELNGYTLCPDIICEEVNGPDYVAVPLKTDNKAVACQAEIGYIRKKNTILSNAGELLIEKMTNYLKG